MKDQRGAMVGVIRDKYGLDSPRVLSSLAEVPREKFAPADFGDIVYEDCPVPIGYGQTMSQPYTVAFMTHLLDLKGNEKVLEIGTGSGYQAAILSGLCRKVYTVEIIPELARRAKDNLKKMGYENVVVREGSGEWGYIEKAPFDAILVTAGIEGDIPEELLDQLKIKGVFVAPVGRSEDKKMLKLTKVSENDFKKEEFGNFRFVPFVRNR